MTAEIHRLILGACNCYLIKEKGLVLVDTGSPNQGGKFQKELLKLSIKPEDISLILLTHGHWDHCGSANELKRLTGGKVAINQHEKDWVEQALKPIPPGVGLWGKLLGTIMKLYVSSVNFPGTSVDLVLDDEEYSLEYYGIRGKVLPTPGHSSGSMSLLLDSGEVFVGDSVMNGFPMRIGPGRPAFADDVDALKESWRLLLDSGASWFYPAHGKPFRADVLRKLL